ncbi:MAG: hypothetical protein IT371_30515 [Deltaproteobacteria bacterium]|nr:hypothetical protein [Deltaproteobacteria bacterium]
MTDDGVEERVEGLLAWLREQNPDPVDLVVALERVVDLIAKEVEVAAGRLDEMRDWGNPSVEDGPEACD